jgi:hypothetical protein
MAGEGGPAALPVRRESVYTPSSRIFIYPTHLKKTVDFFLLQTRHI